MENEKKEPSQSSIHKNEDRNFNSKEESESSAPSKNTEVGIMSDSSIFSSVDEAHTDGEEHRDESALRKLASKKKRSYRRSGKIQKRRAPSTYRRRTIKRTTVKRPTRRNQNVSIQGLSSKSANIPCRYCGHRCCRRFKDRRSRVENGKQRGRGIRRKRIVKRRTNTKKMLISGQEVVSNQAGSRSAMLSPLFLGTNNVLGENGHKRDQKQNCQVMPEMIFVTLQKLSKWTQDVSTDSILKYLRMNYPVTQEIGSLEKELREKLQIATVAGFVKQVSDDTWELTNALQERKLSTTHVTLFWKIYGDTMNPIKHDNNNNIQRQVPKNKKIEFPFIFKL